MKKKSPTKRREDQKNEERKKIEKDLIRKQRSNENTNSKEEIVTLSQMNILPFPKTTLQANDKSYLISFFMFSY